MDFSLDAPRPGAGSRPDHSAPWTSTRDNESHPASLPAAPRAYTFNSFWMASFEGSDQVNCHGQALALNELTGHQGQAGADYKRAAQFQMRTVRESVGWRLSEHDGQFDFSHLEPRARAAATSGAQVIWTLLHYGWPADIDILSEAFVRRFARYAAATAAYLARYSAAAPVYAPIHEISYLAWALCESDLTQTGRRNLRGQSAAIKRQLVRAALAACDAIWSVDPRARILHTDPLIHIAAPTGKAELEAVAAGQRELQFEAWDMLSGRLAPELGGAPHYLDLLGLNYFPGNQWELGGRPLDWHLRDPRRADLCDLLAEVHQRYDRPLLIAETGHTGVGRGAWIREVAEQVRMALALGVPVQGICLYAVVDRPDWNNPSHWHCSGLWDFETTGDGQLERRLNHAYAADLRVAQESLSEQLRQVQSPRQAPASTVATGKRGAQRAQLRGVNLSRA